MNNLHAQATIQWTARYNGTGNISDRATAIAVDNSGNIYVTGTSEGAGTSSDIVTIKYNSSGDSLWVKRYNGPGNGYDYAGSISVDASGNVFVAGGVYNSGGNYDFILIKYNSSGAQQWVSTYNGPGNSDDVINAMTLERTGNIYVTGYSVGVASHYDYATIKYNPAGDSLWVKKYNGTGNSDDYSGAIAVDDSGNVYVTGASTGNLTFNDYATVKYNSFGQQQWVARYNGPANDDDAPSSLVIDDTGNVYVTGSSIGVGTNLDIATIKYNTSGTAKWIARYNGPGNNSESGNSIVIDNQGNLYVGGTVETGSAGKDFAVIKYNNAGAEQWISSYNGTGNGTDAESSLLIDHDANTYVSGYSFGGNTGNDYALVKFNSSGVMQWAARYSEPINGSDIPGASAIDSAGNIYLTGTSFAAATGYDYLTVKFSQPIGIHTISTEVPNHFSLSQNYPNPFNPSTKIKFSIPNIAPSLNGESTYGARGMITSLIIYDILGHEVTTLVNEMLKPGTYEVSFEGSNYSSGVYYYKLTAGDFAETKKMVLLK